MKKYTAKEINEENWNTPEFRKTEGLTLKDKIRRIVAKVESRHDENRNPKK